MHIIIKRCCQPEISRHRDGGGQQHGIRCARPSSTAPGSTRCAARPPSTGCRSTPGTSPPRHHHRCRTARLRPVAVAGLSRFRSRTRGAAGRSTSRRVRQPCLASSGHGTCRSTSSFTPVPGPVSAWRCPASGPRPESSALCPPHRDFLPSKATSSRARMPASTRATCSGWCTRSGSATTSGCCMRSGNVEFGDQHAERGDRPDRRAVEGMATISKDDPIGFDAREACSGMRPISAISGRNVVP
jgi:hypothetical protein